MKFRTTLEIVTKDIQDIEKLVSNFNNYSTIPNIEIDLALSKLRNAYDVLLMLREDTEKVSPGHQVTEPVSGHFKEAPDLQLPEENHPPEIPGDDSHGLVEQRATVKKEQFPDDIFDAGETPVKSKKVHLPKKGIPENEKTIGEKLSSDQAFINQRLGESMHRTDISSVLQSFPIKSITGNLGVNDKFYFIRELFGGDSELFSKVLHELDNSSNFNSAYTYLLNEFSWDMESDPVQKLLNLVRRKFISLGNE